MPGLLFVTFIFCIAWKSTAQGPDGRKTDTFVIFRHPDPLSLPQVALPCLPPAPLSVRRRELPRNFPATRKSCPRVHFPRCNLAIYPWKRASTPFRSIGGPSLRVKLLSRELCLPLSSRPLFLLHRGENNPGLGGEGEEKVSPPSLENVQVNNRDDDSDCRRRSSYLMEENHRRSSFPPFTLPWSIWPFLGRFSSFYLRPT